MSWPVATVGEVCEVVSGATPRTGKPEFWGGNVPWVTPKDLSELRQKHLSDTPRKITKAGLKSCSARMLPAQSVLFSSRAPIGLVAINTLPVCTNQGFKSLVPRFDLVSPDFLFWWLKAQEKHIQNKGRGATFKEVSKKIVEDLQIPLPPLAEQKRIAGILDASDALRAKRREALAQLDTLIQSTFLDMFGDPVTNPMGWRVGRLEDYFSETRAGTCCGPFGSALKKHEYVRDGIPVWGIDNVKPNKFIQERSLFITPAKFAQLRRYSVESGDILISRAGTVGRMCVAVPTVERSIIGSNLIRLSLNPAAMFPVYFVCLYTFCGDRLPGLRASGDEGSYSFLNTTRLKSLVVPLPPLDLQHRFAAIVQSLEQQRTRQRAHLAELDTLLASLQSRAFRGDL